MPKKYDLAVTITGAAGFVGSCLVKRLLEDDLTIRVFGVDVGWSSRLDFAKDNEDFSFDTWDVMQPLHSDMLAVDTFYHFAGIANPKKYMEDPAFIMDLNLHGLRNILDRIVRWSAHRPRIIYSSTSEIYGMNADVPFKEDESLAMFGQGRRWSYASSKYVGEQYLRAFSDKGVDHTILRFFNFVGEGIDSYGHGRVITKMVGDALDQNEILLFNGGQQTRCFVHSKEFVEPLYRLSASKRFDPAMYRAAKNQTINLGTQEEITMAQLAMKIGKILVDMGKLDENQLIVRVAPAESYYGDGYQDSPRRVPDIRKAAEILDWTARLSIDDWLGELVADIANAR